MTTGKKVTVGVLALLIVVSAVGANAAIATDRTMLDERHITDTLQEEGFFEEAMSEAQEEFEQEIDSDTQSEAVSVESGWLTDALDEQYLAGEFERNLGFLLQFLSGDTDTLELYIDLEPVKDELSVSGDDITINTAQFVDDMDFQSEEYDITVTGDMVSQLSEGQDEYDAVRQQIRDDIREQIAEEEQFVDDPDDVPPGAVDEALFRINSELKEQAETEARNELGGDASQNTIDATIELQSVVIDGLTLPPYDDQQTYAADLEEAETNLEFALADEINQEVQNELDDRGDRIHFEEDVREDLDDDELSTIESGITGINTATWLLPLLVLAFAGGIFYLNKSYHETATASGIALGIAGVIGVLAGFIGGRIATSSIEDSMTPDNSAEEVGMDAGIALVDSLFSTFTMQSIYLAVLGIGLVGLVYADREGHLDGVKESLGGSDSDGGQHPPAQQGQQPHPQQGQQPHPQQQGQPPAGQQPARHPAENREGPPGMNQPGGDERAPAEQPPDQQPPADQPRGPPPAEEPQGQPPTEQPDEVESTEPGGDDSEPSDDSAP